MDELSPLFHDIAFSGRLRGYDVAEVDAYVNRVARAASLVQGRIAELQARAEAAELREAPRPAALEGEETMSRVLLLAQRTADAAVAEAQAEASEVLERAHADAAATRADADDYASRVLAEAETDRRRAIVDAETAAAEAIAHERERVTDAIAELEQYHAFLAEDIDILERHVAESRSALATSLSGLADLLETPEAFRSLAMPATSGAIPPSVLEELASRREYSDESVEHEPIATPAIDREPEIKPEPVAGSEPVVLSEEAACEPAPDAWSAGSTEQLLVEDALRPDVDESAGGSGAIIDEELAPREASVAASVEVEAPTVLASDQPEPIPVEENVPPPLLVTSADLDAGRVADEWTSGLHVESGPITEPVPMVSDQLLFEEPSSGAPTIAADPFLAQLRDAVARNDSEEFGDDALAAFFDSEGDDGGRSWFPNRR
ncbi:MAG: DivIVA domain-containing protein [Acidimicrobiales bacterium]|nr:DivIVA domain-containing protein [Acidimicrobiales bacterium]